MNWTFLNHAALWALPLALSPVLIHLLFRKPFRTISFGDLRLLKTVIKKSSPRKKLHERLLLISRILALLFLFLFFSRPILQWGSKSSSGDSLAMVLLIDASYSSQAASYGISLWDREISSAEKVLKSLSGSDRSSAVIFSDQVEFNSGALSDRHADLAAQIKSFYPTEKTTNFMMPLQAAYRTLSNSGAGTKSIMVLSDNAKNGWKDGLKDCESQIKDFDPNVRLLFLQSPPVKKNIAVTDVFPAPDFSGNRVRIDAQVENFGTESMDQVPVMLDIGNPFVKKDEKLVSLRPGEKTMVSLTAPLPENGQLAGKVAVNADELPPDNEYFFNIRSLKKIKVLCAEEPSGIQALTGESFYFREALTAPPSPFEVTTISIGELKRQNLRGFDVISLMDPGEIDEELLTSLTAFQKRGGSLFLSCGARKPPASLSGIFPAKFGDVRETGTLAVKARSSEEDPEFSDFLVGYSLEKVSIYKIIQPVIDEDAVPFLVLSDGTPLLLADRKFRSAVWLSTIDRLWNNAPSKPFYAPLMRFVIGRLGKQGSKASSEFLKAGDPLRRKLEKVAVLQNLSLASPLGKNAVLKPSYREILSEPLNELGLYVFKNGGEQELIPVNADSKNGESSSISASDSDLAALFPHAKISRIDAGEKFESQILSLLRGKEITRIFLILAGLFLLIEMILAARRAELVAALFVLFAVIPARAESVPGNRFVFAQLKTGKEFSDWNPYPQAANDILSFLQQTTSIKTIPENRVVTLEDPALFQSPFVALSGSGRWVLSKDEREILKRYISGGGLLFAEDRSGERGGSFDHAFRNEIKNIFPDKSLSIIPREHAVFRSFYLLRTVGGRRITNNYLEGLNVDGRIAVIYSQNDILGAWAKDLLGNFLYECAPGGEAQRWEAHKLMMNIIIYSVTGNYKTDMIHQPFIEEKLRN